MQNALNHLTKCVHSVIYSDIVVGRVDCSRRCLVIIRWTGPKWLYRSGVTELGPATVPVVYSDSGPQLQVLGHHQKDWTKVAAAVKQLMNLDLPESPFTPRVSPVSARRRYLDHLGLWDP